MAEGICPFQEEHIKVLATLETKVDKLEDNVLCLNRIDKAIEKLSWLMEEQVKGNDKRDTLLNKMSESLENLNMEIKNTNQRIDGLETKFETSEEKNKIDIRDVQKEEVKLSFKEKAKKAVLPFAAIAAFVVALVDMLKGLKILK